MRLGCLLPIITVGLLWGGGQGLYTAATNLKPTACSVQEFIEKKPSAKWLHLTGGVFNLLDVSYSNRFGSKEVKEVWAPFLRPDADPSQPVRILVKTKDPAVLELSRQLVRLNKDEVEKFVAQHHDEVLSMRDVEGLVQFGVDLNDKEQRKLRSLNSNLADDFIVLEEGKRPELVSSAMLFLGGLALGGWLLKSAFTPAKPPTITGLPTPGEAPPPLP